jgi:hypothetical protein
MHALVLITARTAATTAAAELLQGSLMGFKGLY